MYTLSKSGIITYLVAALSLFYNILYCYNCIIAGQRNLSIYSRVKVSVS